MDFRHLVEKGSYKDAEKELTSEWDKGFLKGIDCCIDAIDSYKYYEDEDDDTLGRIRGEIKEQTVEDLKEWLYIERCEAVVGFRDTQGEKRENA